MTGNDIEGARGAGHGGDAQQDFEVPDTACGVNAILPKNSGEGFGVGDQTSGRFCRFRIGTSQQQDLSGLVRVSDQSEDRVGIPGAEAFGCGDIRSPLTGPRMSIADKLSFPRAVELKSEIQPIPKEIDPWIRARTAEQNEVVVGIEIAQAKASRSSLSLRPNS